MSLTVDAALVAWRGTSLKPFSEPSSAVIPRVTSDPRPVMFSVIPYVCGGCILTPYALSLTHCAGCALSLACVGCGFALTGQGEAGHGPLLGLLSFGHLGAHIRVSVLVLPCLVGAILQLECSCVVGRNMYRCRRAWACGGLAVWLLLNGVVVVGGWCRLLFK